MSDIKTAPPSAVPSLTDLATKINSEFAAIQKADQDANKTVVQRAITFGRTLSQAKAKVGLASGRNGSTTTAAMSPPALRSDT